jgi:hypothetical protein
MQKTTHAYRRCHVCGTFCEAQTLVRRCSRCDKPFAPFYYFDDKFSPVLNASGLRAPDLDGQWRPIQGLTAYWAMD